MRKLKIGVVALIIPLLLVGCGQQNEHKKSADSSSSMKMSGSMSGMKMSSSTQQKHSSEKTASSKFKYQEPKLKSYHPISNKKMGNNTTEKDFSTKYAISGTITKVGTVSGGYLNLLVTGSNGQKYLTTIKKSHINVVKAGQKVMVYGSGLTKARGSENGTGISDHDLGQNAMDFSADVIKAN